MENLAFIYGSVNYEDTKAESQLRSPKKMRVRISNLTALGVMGAAIAISAIIPSPADASLVPGDSCASVGQLQAALQQQGYSVGGIDNTFGNDTEYAVEQFQVNNGLVSDGIVGAETATALELDPNISCSSGGDIGITGNSGSSAYVDTNGSPLDVRSGPGLEYSIIDSIPDGTPVPILGQQGNWGQLPTGGWVSLEWIAGR